MSPHLPVIVSTSLVALALCARGAEADTPVTGPGPGIVLQRLLRDPDILRKCPRPPQANRIHKERWTQARVMIDARGTVTKAELSRSSGSAQLDAAALVCLRNARFVPATRNGRPVPAVQELEWTWQEVRPMPLQTCDEPPSYGSLPPGITVTLTFPLEAAAKAAHPDLSGGSSVVCVCTDATGKLIGDPVLSAATGNELLDAETIRLARHVAPLGNAGCARMLFNFE